MRHSTRSDESTKERERRFYRTNNRQASKSFSSKSSKKQCSPLSKFYVKNISKVSPHSTTVHNPLVKSVNMENDTHSRTEKTQLQCTRKACRDVSPTRETPNNLKFQIQFLKREIKKYHEYFQNQSNVKNLQGSNVSESVVELSKKLQQEVSKNWRLEVENKKLKDKILILEQELESGKGDKKCHKSIKTSILQSRIQQYEEQIQKLSMENSQLNKLVKAAERNLCRQSSNVFSQTRIKQMHDSEQIKGLMKKNYDLENEIKHLRVQHSMELIRLNRETETLRESKDKQYLALKIKFMEYLRRYREKYTELQQYQISPTKFYHENSFQIGRIREQEEDNNSLNFSMSEDNDQY